MIERKHFFEEDCGSCPYLPDRSWKVLLHFPTDTLSGGDFDKFMAEGWRRNGRVLYKNICQSCSECLPLRIDVSRFKPKRSQLRALKANSALRMEITGLSFDGDDFSLFQEYSRSRHADGPDVDVAGYLSSFADSCSDSRIVRYYEGRRLMGVAWTDFGEESLSCVYFAFDPSCPRRSLGVFSIMRHVELCRTLGKKYLYLGFLVSGCRKMRYKAGYKPHELLLDDVWTESF